MIENIPLVMGGELVWKDAKPFYTNQMPLIKPYLISLTSRNGGFINYVRYYVFDKNCGGLFGGGVTQIEAINSAKSLYKSYEDKGILIDQMNERILAWNDLWDKYKLAHPPRAKNVVSIKTAKTKLEKKMPKRALVFKKNDGKCFYCNDQLEIDAEWHIEHKQPKSKGGSNELENLVPSCKYCNLKKHNKTAKQYLESSA
jgi:hypothetical protein